jgi:hypothetical protein
VLEDLWVVAELVTGGRVRRVSVEGFGFNELDAKDLGTGSRDSRGIADERPAG